MISIIRYILLPISFIYQFIVWIRNKLYDNNILKSQSFQIPTIVIGNLAIGGAGKSPLTTFLIKYLQKKYKVATLSRGYGRKTKGFKYVTLTSTAIEVGDEPLQFKKNFPNITVAVSEDRCNGIEYLETNNEVILLDDAYQHRKLKAGLYILLFDFQSIFGNKLTLPTGNFRDNFSSTKRADLIVITKCPEIISNKEKEIIDNTITKYSKSPIFYSRIIYNKPIAIHNTKSIDKLYNYDILLFCGIANPDPLITYLKFNNNKVTIIKYPDHYNYSEKDYQKIITSFDGIKSNKKIILTTEKDIQRINIEYFQKYPIYYLPIEVKIENILNKSFENYIEDYIIKNKKR